MNVAFGDAQTVAVTSSTPQEPWDARTQALHHTAPIVPARNSSKPLLIALGACVAVAALLCGGCGLLNLITAGGSDPGQARPGSSPSVVAASMSPVPTAAPSSPVAVTSAPASPTPASAASPKPVYYANCDAVRRAGKAPLRKGSPGYRAELDRDRDGLACESSEGSTTSQPKPTPKPPSGNDPRFSTCKAAKSAGYGPYRRGVDPEYSWYRDSDNDGVVCE